MSEPADYDTHIARITESARVLHAAAEELEKARQAEVAAKALRLAKAASHRDAMDNHQHNIVEGWRAGVQIPQLLDAGKLGKSWLYDLIKKIDAETKSPTRQP